jgi:hypothetical protein
MNTIPPAFREVDGLDAPPWIKMSGPFQEVSRVLLFREGPDLHPEEAHVRRSTLKSNDPQFDPVRPVTDHSQGLGPGQGEVENTSFRKRPAIIDANGDLPSGGRRADRSNGS